MNDRKYFDYKFTRVVSDEDNYYFVVMAIYDIISHNEKYTYGVLKNMGIDDIYNKCKKLANEYYQSGYDTNTKSLLQCIEEFIKYKEKNGEDLL